LGNDSNENKIKENVAAIEELLLYYLFMMQEVILRAGILLTVSESSLTLPVIFAWSSWVVQQPVQLVMD